MNTMQTRKEALDEIHKTADLLDVLLRCAKQDGHIAVDDLRVIETQVDIVEKTVRRLALEARNPNRVPQAEHDAEVLAGKIDALPERAARCFAQIAMREVADRLSSEFGIAPKEIDEDFFELNVERASIAHERARFALESYRLAKSENEMLDIAGTRKRRASQAA